MTTIYFVRHCGVENPGNIAYGRMPGFHLSQSGKEQAKKLGDYFSKQNVVAIYTSPLERTFETANAISAANSKPVTHLYDLIEINAVAWQGLTTDQLFKNTAYENFVSNAKATGLEENLEQVAARMIKITREICQKHDGTQVVCVSHEFPILALRLRLQNKPLETARNLNLSTGSITKLVLDENCQLVESDYIELQ